MYKPVALLMTAYNRQEKLERALASLEPELDLLDIILVDDGSEPPLELRRFAQYPIHLIRLPQNRGIPAAANAGLEYIYGKDYEFVARLDSDDVAINGRFRRQLEFLRAHPATGMVGGQYHAVNERGELMYDSNFWLADEDIRKAFFLGCMIIHSTVMMRTECMRKAGFYDTRYSVTEDYDFLWRMLEIAKGANLPDFVIRCEMGVPDSASRRRRRVMRFNGLRIRLKHFEPWNVYSYAGLLFLFFNSLNLFQRPGRTRSWIRSMLFRYA